MDDKLDILAIMRDDSIYAELLKERIKEVKKDKEGILKSAAEISELYQAEIEEGTRKRALLLSEGAERGLSEDDVMAEYGRFLPTKQTPILNLLYFLLKDDESFKYDELRKEFFEQFGHEYDGLNKELLEEKYGREVHEEAVDDNVETPPTMDEFIYGNMTHDMFKKIKKLKALSNSDNEHEAARAFTICKKLCKEYGLEFDKIPS